MVGCNLLDHPDIKQQFKIISPRRQELDLLNFYAVKSYLEKNRPDMIIHAAGKVGGIQANIREPVAFLLDNLDIGRNIILAAKKVGIKHLINLGSSCMYPRNYLEPMSEEMILKGELEPTNEGYALAKVITARLCDYVMREDSSYYFKTIIPCNIYGRFDKFDPDYSHLIPAIIYKIHFAKQNHQEVVEIWGNGKARREFMYAGDLADALVRSIMEFNSLPMIMNIGLGYDYTINEYYQIVADVIGYKGKFFHNLSKPVGMFRKLVSIERQKSWGWSASYSLQDGITETYKYFLKEYFH